MVAVPADFRGLRIEAAAIGDSIRVDGVLQVYVARGSQMAIWRGFPHDIQLTVTEVGTGRTFVTMDLSMNISPHASLIEHYAAMPADRVVSQTFSQELRARLPDLPSGLGTLEIAARYLQHYSNAVRVHAER